jgi:hypothetical protein
MKALYSLYPNQGAAQEAVDLLRVAGVSDRDIIIRSAAPLDDCELGRGDAATWLPWISTAGGAVGLGVGTWLPRATAASWPLLTGGIPAASWWANLIVMFELMMLGAILATVAGFIVTAGLTSRSMPIHEPALADGWVLVGVMTSQPSARVENVLDPAGAGRIRMVN